MATDDPTPDPNDPPDDDTEITAEVRALVGEEASKDAKVLSALIGAKKQLRASERRVKELEPSAARVTELEGKLEKVAPIVSAVVNNPKLRAEAIRIAKGTRTSGEATEQPTEGEDPDAAAHAEDMGFYLADGETPDVARARRVLDRLDARHGRQTDEKMRPLASMTLGDKARDNIRQAMRLTDDDGVPLCTKESLKETVEMLGGEDSPMLANTKVVDLLVNNAIGLDRRKGRKPAASDDPLFLASPGGGRRGDQISAEDRAFLKRSGMDEKFFKDINQKLSTANPRKGIALE